MKLCRPLFEIWKQSAGLEGVYKQIERVGRVCYKSEDKITEDSAKPFVDRMIKSGHGAMLEHGTVYLQYETVKSAINPLTKYYLNKYSKVKAKEGAIKETTRLLVTTNFRVLVENGWLDDLQYICEPTEFHEKRVTVHFVCDRGVSHEFVRHRVMSFAQESTRYCNYSKDKFGNELTFIIPCWMDIPEGGAYWYDGIGYRVGANSESNNFEEICGHIHKGDTAYNLFLASLESSEKNYIKLLKQGWKPQEARAVLPNSLKTELVVTGFVSDWKKFFRLRSRIAETGKPHPQAQELADPLMDEFVKRGIMETLL